MHERRRRCLSGDEPRSLPEEFSAAVYFLDSIQVRDRWNWEHQGRHAMIISFLQRNHRACQSLIQTQENDRRSYFGQREYRSPGGGKSMLSYSSWPPMFDNSFEVSPSLKNLDLNFIGLLLVGVLVLTLGAFKYIEANRSPVRTVILFLDFFTAHSL